MTPHVSVEQLHAADADVDRLRHLLAYLEGERAALSADFRALVESDQRPREVRARLVAAEAAWARLRALHAASSAAGGDPDDAADVPAVVDAAPG
jgi:hypothetical protein